MTAENVAASPPTKPTVPVDRVVERIVNQTLDAAFESGEKLHVASLIKAAGDAIVQHPAQGTIILWLAEEKLEGSSTASPPNTASISIISPAC
jgi:hypothetical protein